MDLLEQLILEGNATKEFVKLDGKLKFTLRTLTGKQQLEIWQVCAR
jgi:hypothetical protein